MENVLDVVITSFLSVLTVFIGVGLKYTKTWLVNKIGREQLKQAYDLAMIVVNGIEQTYGKELDIYGKDKKELAVDFLQKELNERNIKLTDEQIDLYIESAVKQIKESVK